MAHLELEDIPQSTIDEWTQVDPVSYYAARFGVGDIPIALLSTLSKENSYE